MIDPSSIDEDNNQQFDNIATPISYRSNQSRISSKNQSINNRDAVTSDVVSIYEGEALAVDRGELLGLDGSDYFTGQYIMLFRRVNPLYLMLSTVFIYSLIT